VNLDQISRRRQPADIQFTCDFRGYTFYELPKQEKLMWLIYFRCTDEGKMSMPPK